MSAGRAVASFSLPPEQAIKAVSGNLCRRARWIQNSGMNKLHLTQNSRRFATAALLIPALALTGITSSALADTGSSGVTLIQGQVNGATLFFTAAPANDFTLAQSPTNSDISSANWTDTIAVHDNRGNGDGWSLAVSSISYLPVAGESDAASNLQTVVGGVSVVNQEGNDDLAPANDVVLPVSIPSGDNSTPTAILDAERFSGMGNFIVTMNATTTGPSNAAGSSFQPVVTLSTANGPS